MNIFHKIALQSMKKSRTRTIVTIIGVILSAAMFTAVVTFAFSLQNYMINGAIMKYGDWHVEFSDVDTDFVQERSRDDTVLHTTAIENIGYARLEGGKNPDKPYLFITGFTEEGFDSLPISLISGRLPTNSEEILISAHIDTNGGVAYSVGDKLSLAVGERSYHKERLNQHIPFSGKNTEEAGETFMPKEIKEYVVVGICERPAFEEFAAPGYTVITTADEAKAEKNFNLFVTLKNPRQIHDYVKNAAESQVYRFNDDVLRFMGLSDDAVFNTLLYSVGGVLTVLIMIGSIFLIYNSFHISLNERIRQFGILSSVGATAKQLRNSVLFEGTCIGMMGIPIGVMIGIVSTRVVIFLVTENFAHFLYSTVPLTLTVSVPAILIAVVVSMVTILISAYIPAHKAVNTPIMESIRQTNEIKIDSGNVKISRFAQQVYGLEGILARKNFNRNKKRYGSIVLSLTLSVVLFVSGSAFGTHLKKAAEQTVVHSDYDICFTSKQMEKEEMFWLYDQLKAVDGVYDSSYQAMSTYSCEVKEKDFSDQYREYKGYEQSDDTISMDLDIQFIEDSIFLQFIDSLGLSAEEYTGLDAQMIAVAKERRTDETQGEKQVQLDIFSNPDMNVLITPKTEEKVKTEERINITFVDTIPFDTLPRHPSEVKPYVFMIVAPYQMKERFSPSGTQEKIGLTFLSKNPSQTVAEMEAIIQGSGVISQYTLYNIHKMMEQNRSIIFVVDVFTYVFVIMISLIAVANVFNTISTNIKLRRRELAMLRSVGMSDSDFRKMMNFECVFYGMRTLIIGVPLALLSSWLIYKGLWMGGAEIDYLFPWESLGISVLGVFFVIFISMVYATGKIKGENIIDALRDDMI